MSSAFSAFYSHGNAHLDERKRLKRKFIDVAHSIRTPANWMPGGDIIIPRSIKVEEAKV